MQHIIEATHIEPYTKAYYRIVDGQWYVWSRINLEPKHWIKSKGTVEKCLYKNPLHNRTVGGVMRAADRLRFLISEQESINLTEVEFDSVLLLEEIYRLQKKIVELRKEQND